MDGMQQTGPTGVEPSRPKAGTRPLGASALLRRLMALQHLSETEQRLVPLALSKTEHVTRGANVVAEGDVLDGPGVILQGWACRQRVLSDGRRAILGVLMPGDGVGLHGEARRPSGCSVLALTPLVVADASPLLRAAVSGGSPGILRGLAALRAVEEDLQMDHALRLGALSAHERVAHMLLELEQRCRMAGLGSGGAFPLPLTQEHLRDALGMSAVHLNRVLGRLRREGMLELRGGFASLPRPAALAEVCEYEFSRFRIGLVRRA
jgi:CRP-like cAMP-binding protein